MADITDITPTFPTPPASETVVLPALPSDAGTTVIGGFMASPTSLKQGQISLNGVGEQILVGAATDPVTGIGIFIGNNGQGGYDFRAGDPAGSYIHWDAHTALLTVVGSIHVTVGGTIGGFDVGADYVRDVANSFGLASTVTGGDDVRFWAGDTFANRATAPFHVTEAGVVAASNLTITGGSVATSVLDVCVVSANSNIVFTSTNNTKISWSSGSITTAKGITYTISAGDTGTMSALTYIYLDIAISTTVLQTTTTLATANGNGKILVATAQNETSGGAYCIPYLGGAPLLNGAAQINASSILAAQISVSSLSAVSANLGTITTGTITMDTAGYIRGGQTDFNTGTGFFLGYSGAAYKFSVGSPTGARVTWDGSALNIVGVNTVTRFFTAGEALTAGDAVFIAAGTEVDTLTYLPASNFYNVTNNTSDWFAQTFLTRAETGAISITGAKLRLAQNQVVSGNYVIALRATSGGAPTGSNLASVTIAFPIGEDYVETTVDATFTSPYTAVGNTEYAIVVYATSLNGAGAHQLLVWGATGYADGGNFINGSSQGKDYLFAVKQAAFTAGSVYKTSTATGKETMYPAFIGFVATTTARAGSVPINIGGESMGLSSLTIGAHYYLADAYGTIGTTAGTNTRKVGTALSATNIEINNIW
jgi:hypothetical protein